MACDATNTASASDAATRNSVASRDDDARRRTARYHAETRDASPPRRRISATANTRAATIATPSANSSGNRKAADAGRSTVVPVTPPPERRCRTITYAPASAKISHGRNITSRASPARGSCFDAKANAVTVPTSAMTATIATSEPTTAEVRAEGSMIPVGPSQTIMAVATRKPATAPTMDGSADSSAALTPIRPGPHPRTESTPASTRLELNEKIPAAATTPNAITRAATNSTWIGPATAASRWSTMPTTPVMVPSNSVVVPCNWKKNSRPQHGKIFRSSRSEVMRSLRRTEVTDRSRASSSVIGSLMTGAANAKRARGVPSCFEREISCARSTRIGWGGGAQSGHWT